MGEWICQSASLSPTGYRLKLFAWICMHLCARVHSNEVSGSEAQQPVCRRLDLCDALSEVWSKRGKKVRTHVKSGLLAWVDAYAHSHRLINAYPWRCIVQAAKWSEWGLQLAFLLPKLISFNECPTENESACIIVYGWTPWSSLVNITHFVLLCYLFQLNKL